MLGDRIHGPMKLNEAIPVLLVIASALAACASSPTKSSPSAAGVTERPTHRDGILNLEICVHDAANPRTRRMSWRVGGVEVDSLEAVKAELEIVKATTPPDVTDGRPLPRVRIVVNLGTFYADYAAVAELAEQLGFAIPLPSGLGLKPNTAPR